MEQHYQQHRDTPPTASTHGRRPAHRSLAPPTDSRRPAHRRSRAEPSAAAGEPRDPRFAPGRGSGPARPPTDTGEDRAALAASATGAESKAASQQCQGELLGFKLGTQGREPGPGVFNIRCSETEKNEQTRSSVWLLLRHDFFSFHITYLIKIFILVTTKKKKKGT